MVVFWRAVSVSREDARADKDGVAPLSCWSLVGLVPARPLDTFTSSLKPLLKP